ncbi:MAG TPA: EAL domain-containing response regulator [Xanthobacteraceae bacterium]|nr:EAL domain-containing response regulator [Xanthobacteraceae bacterium]
MDEPLKRPRSAFVLDDDPCVGLVLSRMLTALAVENRHFVDPSAFLAEAQAASPDLILLDLALGQSDAIDLIRKLEALQYRGRVLLVSGKDIAILKEAERIGRAHGLWMLPPLQKPVRLADLQHRLDAPSQPPAAHDGAGDTAAARLAASPQADLGEALREGWVEVWYQPKIDLKSLRATGAEALVRVRHPVRGVVAPIDFLPPASDPLYKPLTAFVMRQAMADWLVFAARGFFPKLAVNVPASVLNTPDFVDVLRRMIPDAPGFPGLVLEITEDEIIRDPEWLREIATQVRLYNAAISIDDFGSAYASLSRLKDLPFSELKLDCSFVTGCAADPLKRSLCQTVVDLGHRFGATVCAEGVEQEGDLRSLISQSFDTAQGFFFAKPMPASELMEFLTKDTHWQIGLADPQPAATQN